MDVMDVFVVIGYGYTREEVEKILIEDGYEDNFIFGDKFDENDPTWQKLIDKSDEVWGFGKTNLWGIVAKWQWSYANKTKKVMFRMG